MKKKDFEMIDTIFQSPYNKVKYRLLGDDQATVYFGINEFTGRITVKRPLSDGEAVTYRVGNFSY